MIRHHREALAIISGLLEPRGLVCTMHHGGVHHAVVVTTKAGRLRAKFPLSCTPRDPDAQLNQVRQQVKAWMDRAGLNSGRGGQGSRKTHRRSRVRSIIHRVEVMEDPQTGPARDPWAVLAGLR